MLLLSILLFNLYYSFYTVDVEIVNYLLFRFYHD